MKKGFKLLDLSVFSEAKTTQCLCLIRLCAVCIPSSIQAGFLEISSYCKALPLIEGIKMPDITVSQRGSPPNHP